LTLPRFTFLISPSLAPSNSLSNGISLGAENIQNIAVVAFDVYVDQGYSLRVCST